MSPRAILFDLDETLTDRSKSLMKYSNAFMERFNYYLMDVTSEHVYRLLKAADGNGYRSRDEVFAQLVQELPWSTLPPETSQMNEHWSLTFPLCSEPTFGMYELLDDLKSRGIILGIVTNGGTISQNKKIDSLGIRDYFETIIISETVKMKKPDAGIFNLGLKESNVDASETWYIGDHPTNDILGSSNAGLTPVWIRGIHPWVDGNREPKYQIDSINQVLSLIQAVRSMN
ncbi:HAD family hydrolase [Cohnella ginsengisoli]|uniref:HAD family hydrolase n=1 Tax=Cohnella ginsengisoli TaxID=425004 RepID=A0A9X4QMB7_9BACL|nr:HAD family hydrolase [Cohnella ginsengisoli]MDG0791166.1 HAD family hydrolase [Cohnella ginsengisoli]